jgi:hypothetical protein
VTWQGRTNCGDSRTAANSGEVMNCVELQHSLAEADDGSTAEQRAHLRTCPTCSALVKELHLIAAAAGQLRDADEPSPRVWNSIEIALHREGLIHPPPASNTWFPSFNTQWATMRWLVPAAAALLLAFGIYTRHQLEPSNPANSSATAMPEMNDASLNDDDLLQEISDNSPEVKTLFAENLRQVNDSIRDAQDLVAQSPNDVDARRSLMDAYQQKSMLFELAMDQPVR